VQARPGTRVATVLGEEDPDVVPLGGAGDERGLHVHDRRVPDERARIDHTARTHLEAGDRDVVGGAVVHVSGQVVDAGLGEPGDGGCEQDEQHQGGAHKALAYLDRRP
jgi:hypothetical protein